MLFSKFLQISILFCGCLKFVHGASYCGYSLDDAFQPIFQTGRPSGVVVCEQAKQDIGAIIFYKSFDRFLLSSDGGDGSPDFTAYDYKSHADLMQFYSDNELERNSAISKLHTRFLRAIKSVSSLSYSHPEFKVLSYFAECESSLLYEVSFKSDFVRIFQETDEFRSLYDVIERVGQVSKAIEESKGSEEKKSLEKNVRDSLGKIPHIMTLANRYYLPTLKEHYLEMLGDLDNRTFSGRLALTKTLISHGELVKTIPDKKDSPASKVCALFRDKAVKVLPRRLARLQDDADSISGAYQPILIIWLSSFHAYIFDGGEVPADNASMNSLLAAWGYRPNGKPLVVGESTAVVGDEEKPETEFLKEILIKMREISRVNNSFQDCVFFEEVAGIWGTFKCDIHNLYAEVIGRYDMKEARVQSPVIEKEREKFIRAIDMERVTVWPNIVNFTSPERFHDTCRQLNTWLKSKQQEIASKYSLTLSDKDYFIPSRRFHVRLQLRLQHVLETFDFKSPTNNYPAILESMSPDPATFDALKLLGYTFVQNALEQNVPTLKPFEEEIKRLRNIWAHPKIADLEKEWREILPILHSIPDRNDLHAMLTLMIGLENFL